jgi:hypothetical protein
MGATQMKKSDLQVIIDQFPDDVDTEELMYRLYLIEKIERSEASLARGEGITHEELVKQTQEWFK